VKSALIGLSAVILTDMTSEAIWYRENLLREAATVHNGLSDLERAAGSTLHGWSTPNFIDQVVAPSRRR
jgi:hypothetical protein